MVTLPLTDETRGLIGEREIGLMPKNSVLVNIGRGPVVEQEALYHALKSGKLHSAGIDVWYNYPPDEEARAHTPPADFPFHELDNIVMSPHRGGGASEVEILRMAHLANLLNAAARGDQIPNQVDLKRGY
jgi:phosphoglycerate dehydrogenase-like enzyme